MIKYREKLRKLMENFVIKWKKCIFCLNFKEETKIYVAEYSKF